MRAPRRGVLLGAGLGASLALNLALGGLLLAGPGRAPHGGGGGGRGFDRMVARMEHALPEADRPAFRAVLDTERGRYEGALADVRAAQREVDAAMTREPFDAASLRSAMAAWSGRWTAFSAAFADTMVRAMAAVSPQGRAQVAAARRRDG
jgi:uncharacterized membrane protein